MHPILFTLGDTQVHAYVFMTVAAFVAGVLIGGTLAVKDGRDPWDVVEGAAVIVLAAVLGSKVFHVLFESAGHKLPSGETATGIGDLLAADPWHWARLLEPGYVFYGGVVFAVAFGVLFIQRRGIDRLGAVFDYAAPGFVLGIAIGRAGCFLAGCCHGGPTDLGWAVTYPAGHVSGGIPVHPVQLYDVTFGLVALAFIIWYWNKRRFEGEVFAIAVTSYAVWRFTSEFFRGDGDRGVWFGGLLSTSQIVSLCVLPIAIFVWKRQVDLAKAREDQPAEPESDVEVGAP